MRICFLNPFGTPVYDQLIHDVLSPSLSEGTTVEIRHLDGPIKDMDYFVPKHLLETGVIKAALAAEADGFDAFVTGCCYDPGLTQCREIVNIPVVGPLEASIGNVRAFGQRYAIVTDHHKAATEIADRVRLYGQEANCKAVTSIGWYIEEMIKDPAAVAADAFESSKQVMAETGAETVIIACTIIAGCYEVAAADDPALQDISVIDPNVVAVKQAEMLAGLRAAGRYRIARTGYYQSLAQHDATKGAELREYLARL
jgi:allantoin racemase